MNRLSLGSHFLTFQQLLFLLHMNTLPDDVSDFDVSDLFKDMALYTLSTL